MSEILNLAKGFEEKSKQQRRIRAEREARVRELRRLSARNCNQARRASATLSASRTAG
ncbi:MbeB family mobilization protein [Klebsiella variicola]|uniref:MbeB family mobilization protein n=1 Tax=Klebsiella variicola TaxID=244366 RepID=UPI003977E0DE